MQSLITITPPTVEPITLAEARATLRLGSDETALDDDIELAITAAREWCENYTRRAYVQRTYELVLSCFPRDGVIELPMPPLRSVTSITYVDTNGDEQTLATSQYLVRTAREPGHVRTAYDVSWPDTHPQESEAVRVRYVAGYEAPAGSPTDYTYNVPAAVKRWLRMNVATRIENPQALAQGVAVNELSRDFTLGDLDPYIVQRLI